MVTKKQKRIKMRCHITLSKYKKCPYCITITVYSWINGICNVFTIANRYEFTKKKELMLLLTGSRRMKLFLK